jgi:hypothetical protein
MPLGFRRPDSASSAKFEVSQCAVHRYCRLLSQVVSCVIMDHQADDHTGASRIVLLFSAAASASRRDSVSRVYHSGVPQSRLVVRLVGDPSPAGYNMRNQLGGKQITHAATGGVSHASLFMAVWQRPGFVLQGPTFAAAAGAMCRVMANGVPTEMRKSRPCQGGCSDFFRPAQPDGQTVCA